MVTRTRWLGAIKRIGNGVLQLGAVDACAVLSLLLTMLILAVNVQRSVKAALIVAVWIVFGIQVYRILRK